jgi:hypothetical protein
MRAILISLLFIMVSAILFAQSGVYHPIPVSGAIWREYFGGYQVNCTDYQLSITGDTLIEDKVYHKLQQFGVTYFSDPMGNCIFPAPIPYTYYPGAFRNDSIDRKVYFFSDGQLSEKLLYDFNLHLNDKLPETYRYQYGMNSDTAYISRIDSVMIGNEYHQRYAISIGSLLEYMYLIEGIGSSYGLLSELNPPFEFGSNLLCFMQDSITVYPDPGYDCVLVTGADDHPQVVRRFSISPNPIISGIGVVNMLPDMTLSELFFYDVVGKEVLRINDIKQGSVIHAENLHGGLYFYFLINDNQVFATGKLLVVTK